MVMLAPVEAVNVELPTTDSVASGALTAVGAVRATTTAATEAWKRVNISGTFTSATILVTAGTVSGT